MIDSLKGSFLILGFIRNSSTLSDNVLHPTNECPVYDSKQSDGEDSAMLELWGKRSTSLLPSLPCPLWSGVVAPDKGPIYG